MRARIFSDDMITTGISLKVDDSCAKKKATTSILATTNPCHIFIYKARIPFLSLSNEFDS